MTKIEVLRNLIKIEIFQNFRKNQKSKFFENLTQIEIFSTIWLKSKFFKNLTQNRNFFEYYDENFDKNRNFSKILTKIEQIFRKFDEDFKIEIFRNFRRKSKFFENLNPNRNFSKFSKSKFFVMFWQNRNRNFSTIWPKSKFFENLTYSKLKFFEIFRKFWRKSKFFENFTKIEIFRKIDQH